MVHPVTHTIEWHLSWCIPWHGSWCHLWSIPWVVNPLEYAMSRAMGHPMGYSGVNMVPWQVLWVFVVSAVAHPMLYPIQYIND